jgi:hypothetical protein
MSSEFEEVAEFVDIYASPEPGSMKDFTWFHRDLARIEGSKEVEKGPQIYYLQRRIQKPLEVAK